MLQIREVESSLRNFSDCSFFASGQLDAHERLHRSLSIRFAWLYSVKAWVALALIHNLGF